MEKVELQNLHFFAIITKALDTPAARHIILRAVGAKSALNTKSYTYTPFSCNHKTVFYCRNFNFGSRGGLFIFKSFHLEVKNEK